SFGRGDSVGYHPGPAKRSEPVGAIGPRQLTKKERADRDRAPGTADGRHASFTGAPSDGAYGAFGGADRGTGPADPEQDPSRRMADTVSKSAEHSRGAETAASEIL